ncbi:anaphase-promoting complex subunit Cut9 [Melanomma pulvis-pyrius CBS 109.77]|uniref:Anaphase-promoting complex subunit Cut9 n=1 Tax=Melanomma pulvis-pyrius CBS 109.77 TaxID=1314802 RepID=A0A6A6XBM5_9PLEO|nr:anaphase-promoting complex subunit Cut9 [Melanomma pulvis-pyrius CBS 109.77]
MERFLREWRQDAVNKHQYETAIFVADKLLALTRDDNDAYWLAQVHFSTGNYSRAQTFLSRGSLLERQPQCRYLAAHCSIKLGKTDEALTILGDKNPTHLISAPGSERQKLRHVDVNSRVGARHHKAASRSDRQPTSEERDKEDVSSLKYEAGMCYLRGVCYAKQNSFDRAKECYKIAVQIDVQCFEAFDALMANSLMSPAEEWKFLESLNFDTISVSNNPSLSQEAAQFTRTLYTTRLSKYSRPDEFANATESLSTHYNLSDNADILLSKADLKFTQCRFREALALTSSVLSTDKYNFAILPVHLACLHELGQKNALFLLSHDLADTHPSEPCSWLAVGIYYLCISRIAEARRYFSKASMMDPHFGPAWIGFAHTFAAEGEHDQAISAYSTAARLFQGTHLPQLFLGMQNLQLNNLSLAHEYLNTAFDLCQTDPLLLNEMGVVYYHEDALIDAISMFRRALTISDKNEADPDAWIPTRTNLAHALRRSGQLDEALATFDEVLRHGVKDSGIFTAKGLVLLEMGRSWDAVIALHEALAVTPQDPMATDLLGRALEANESDNGVLGAERRAGNGDLVGSVSDEEIEEIDRKIGGRLKEIEQNRVAGRGGRRRRDLRVGMIDVDESGFGESMLVDSDG